MSNLSVKNRVKLINNKFVGSTKGFNNLPRYQKNNNTNNTWNVNDVIPENFYVSPPNSPTGLNSPISVASNVGSVESFVAPAPAAVAAAAVSMEDPVEHNYSANIAAWKSRNTTKNKKYKTRANYNSKSNANLKAQLAQLSQQTLYNTSGEEHSAQYWQNKRAANAAKVSAKPATKAPSKWGPVPTGKLIRTRKNRKSRKNRK